MFQDGSSKDHCITTCNLQASLGSRGHAQPHAPTAGITRVTILLAWHKHMYIHLQVSAMSQAQQLRASRCYTSSNTAGNNASTKTNSCTARTHAVCTRPPTQPQRLPAPSMSWSLAAQQVQAQLTVFPKYFSSVPHGTCPLSDSNYKQHFACNLPPT